MELLRSGISFGIVTNGKRPAALQEEIDSIRRLQIPRYEIIVAGEVPSQIAADRTLDLVSAARHGDLGLMRNRLAEAARFDTVVTVDDDFLFHENFYSGLLTRGEAFDILSTRVLNPDGTRFWDWAVFGAPSGHHLISYEETSPYLYVTGGFSVQRREVILDVRWPENRSVNQAEDVDYSFRAKQKGYRIEFCAQASVTHNDPSYTEVDDFVFRSPIPGTLDQLGGGILGEGFYPKEGDGSRFVKPRARIVLPASSLNSPSELIIRITSISGSLYTSFPLSISFYVDGRIAATVELTDRQNDTAIRIPVNPSRDTTCVEIIASGAVPAQLFGNHRDRRIIAFRLHGMTIQPRSIEGANIPPSVPDRQHMNSDRGIKLIGQELDGTIGGLFARQLLPYFVESWRGTQVGIEPVRVDPLLIEELRKNPASFKHVGQLLANSCDAGKVLVSLPLNVMPDPDFLERVWVRHRNFQEREVLTYARSVEEARTHASGLDGATRLLVWGDSQVDVFCAAGIEQSKIQIFTPPSLPTSRSRSESPILFYLIEPSEKLEVVFRLLSHLLAVSSFGVELGIDAPPWKTEEKRVHIRSLLGTLIHPEIRGRIRVAEAPLLDSLPAGVTHLMNPLESPNDPRYRWLANSLGVDYLVTEAPVYSRWGLIDHDWIKQQASSIGGLAA